MLPPLYKMENYKHCAEDPSNYYCWARARLLAPSKNVELFNIIQNLSLDMSKLDRKFIYRTLCINKETFLEGESHLYSYSSSRINQEISIFKLNAAVEDVKCSRIQMEISLYDYVFLFTVVFYFLLILLGTIKGKVYEKENGLKYVISRLSLFHTWKNRFESPPSTDYKKLVHVDGCRVVAVFVIIFVHVMLIYTATLLSEPEVFEQIFPILNVSDNLPVLMVLFFFLMSSWLLTIQVHNIHERGQLALKNVGILIINRYFRINFLITLLLLLCLSSWSMLLCGPSNYYILMATKDACTNYWLPIAGLFVNYFKAVNICYPVTWSMSADFQLYVLNVFILYIKFKYKLNDVKFYASVLTLSIILHGVVLQTYDAGPMYQAKLRHLEVPWMYYSMHYVVAYMSTSSIWSSSLIGVILGTVYIKTKHIDIKPSMMLNIVWLSTSLGLIYLAIRIGAMEIHGIKASLFGSIVKPIFCLGCGLAVYGLSHNLGGPIKRLLESKVLVILGKCTYCIIFVHPAVALFLQRNNMDPLYVNFWKVIQDYVETVILSFLLGILATIGIEETGNMLQKKILPQINKWEKISKVN